MLIKKRRNKIGKNQTNDCSGQNNRLFDFQHGSGPVLQSFLPHFLISFGLFEMKTLTILCEKSRVCFCL